MSTTLIIDLDPAPRRRQESTRTDACRKSLPSPFPPEGINRRFSQSQPTPRPRQAGTNPTAINLALRISGNQPQSGKRQIRRIPAERGNKPYGRWPKSPAPPPPPPQRESAQAPTAYNRTSHPPAQRESDQSAFPSRLPTPQRQESTAGPDTGKIATLNNPDTADTDAPADALNK